MNSIVLFKKAIFRVTILLFYIEFISISLANNPTITGIYPLQGVDENGQISLLGTNFSAIKQVLFQTSSGIVAVPQIVNFKDYLKVYFVPKDAINAALSVVGTFGVLSTKVQFNVGIPSVAGILYSTDKEGKNYLIVMGENLNFIEQCHFKTINEEPSIGVFNYFGAYAQVYIPRNAKNGTISISGLSFGRLNTKYDFINSSLHIPEHIENIDLNENIDSILKAEIEVFPNPSFGNFNIKSHMSSIIEVYNSNSALISKTIATNEITKISIYQKGLFFIKVITKEGVIIKKMLID